MKKNAWMILLASLALAACQDNTAPQQASMPAETEHSAQAVVPAQPAATSSDSVAVPANLSESVDQSVAESKALQVEATDTVAVTKPAKSSAAATIQQSMVQAKAAAVATAADLVAKVNTEASGATAKATQPKKVDAPKTPPTVVQPAASEKPVAESAAAASLVAVGDIAKGKVVANKCKTCHNFTEKKKIGPGLKGIVGRKAGIMSGMKYSTVLAAGGWVWTEKNIAMWDCDSKKAIKVLSGNPAAKTRMPVQRICDPQKQADLIAFLKTL
ncbi:MAG: cytochrome c [Mariprofundus sp.]|nr:cytochrome c [Mariprofundus sp.]